MKNTAPLRLGRRHIHFVMALGLLVTMPALAETGIAPAMAHEERSVHYQATYIYQQYPGMRAAYTGPNSLSPDPDKSYTFTATAFLGTRLWQDGELYFNYEGVQGSPFTGNLVGMGTSANGEITRTSGPSMQGYIPRFFLRQTWNQGGGTEQVDAQANQLAGSVDSNRFVLTAGKFSALDIFDNNVYAKDSRTQFMNAANMAYSAYDYASDARGYSWGFAGEWYRENWVVRFGRVSGPTEPNGPTPDLRLDQHYGDQIELERAHKLRDQPGKVRLLAWRNQAHLARFNDATNYGNSVNWVPDPANGRQYIFNARDGHQVKYGMGLNIEQAVNASTGMFLRALWADGASETHAFTEVDRSVAAGIAINGGQWNRAGDTLGFAFMANAISPDRRRYLEAGGISFFIGDGALNYRPETIFESYYSGQLWQGIHLTLDYQHVNNPAYNADRGPVDIVGARLHFEN